MQIKGRTFIISGGSSGLGFATAQNIISNGGYASVLDVNAPPAGQLDEQRSHFTKTDVSSSDSLQAAVKATLQWTQATSAPLAGVVCCAGIGTAALALPKQNHQPNSSTTGGNPADYQYYDMRIFDRTLSINLRGTVDLIRLTLPHLSANEPEGPDDERGVIVVVSSVAAYEGQVGQLAYSASKGAVASIVLPLARELGPKAGIRVMGIAPGVFETGMTKAPKPRASSNKSSQNNKKKAESSTSAKAGINREMVQYPMRMGQGFEFARLVKEIVENAMLNGFVIRLDGAVRMPSRL